MDILDSRRQNFLDGTLKGARLKFAVLCPDGNSLTWMPEHVVLWEAKEQGEVLSNLFRSMFNSFITLQSEFVEAKELRNESI